MSFICFFREDLVSTLQLVLAAGVGSPCSALERLFSSFVYVAPIHNNRHLKALNAAS